VFVSSRREAIRELLHQGLTQAAVARELGVSPAMIAYHARRLGLPADPRFARRHDWAEVQAYYDAGHSLAQCQERFGFAKQSWNDAVRRGAVVPRPRAMPVEELLGGRRGRWHVKARLFRLGLKENRCERCGLHEWRGAPLSMALHHVNGDGDDNRLENLELLCPNCHSQTANFAGRKRSGRSG